jgi:hypothetical protein
MDLLLLKYFYFEFLFEFLIFLIGEEKKNSYQNKYFKFKKSRVMNIVFENLVNFRILFYSFYLVFSIELNKLFFNI